MLKKCFDPDCNNMTNNPKFCSSNCSARYNNKIHVKRKKRTPSNKACLTCGAPTINGRKYCSTACNPRNYVATSTPKEIREKASLAGTIRWHSRTTYINSGKEMKCVVCGYDTHVEICHIKQICEFDENTPVITINDISNLVALCPNHHWEFDRFGLMIPIE